MTQPMPCNRLSHRAALAPARADNWDQHAALVGHGSTYAKCSILGLMMGLVHFGSSFLVPWPPLKATLRRGPAVFLSGFSLAKRTRGGSAQCSLSLLSITTQYRWLTASMPDSRHDTAAEDLPGCAAIASYNRQAPISWPPHYPFWHSDMLHTLR